MARDAGPLVTLRGSRATVTGHAPGELAVLDVNGETIGTMHARFGRGEATIEAVVIDAERRGFGYGGEAVRLFEAWAEREGVNRFRARVEASNGLGVYFLLRLGYSPTAVRLAEGGEAALEMSRKPG